ncbi:MAG: SecDF P1 head subdomain-containing protein [Pirellulaceae bacterium]
MQNQIVLLVSLSCLMAPLSAGCGTKPAADPLAGIGGYRLVYKQKEGRKVDAVQIERVIRERLNAKDGEVVVQLVRGGGYEILLPGAGEQRVAEVKKVIASSNVLRFLIVALKGKDDELIAVCQDGKDHSGAIWIEYDPEKHKDFPAQAVLATTDGKSKLLMLKNEQSINAGHLEYVSQGNDEAQRPCIHCQFNAEGASRMQKLTSANLQRQLAIIIDGKLINAPTIQSAVGSRCQVTGNFTEDEIVSLVAPLRQAQMFADLEPNPISEEKVAAGSKK